jgi:hypothetical protein
MQSDADVQKQIREVLKRFNNLILYKNIEVLAEFAPDDDTILIGSEPGEIARGYQALEAFFTRIFVGEETFSWEWDRIEVSYTDNLAWFLVDGRVVLTTVKEQRKSPYRNTGVSQRQGERWLGGNITALSLLKTR